MAGEKLLTLSKLPFQTEELVRFPRQTEKIRPRRKQNPAWSLRYVCSNGVVCSNTSISEDTEPQGSSRQNQMHVVSSRCTLSMESLRCSCWQ